MKVSSPSLAQGRVIARLVASTMLACALAACGGREQQQEERAKRARQMRDVSRMLDAMEADKPARMPTAPSAAPAMPPAGETPPDNDASHSLLATLAIGVAGGLAMPALVMFAWRRRKRRAMPVCEPPSIAVCFAEPPADAQPPAPVQPTWIYRSSSFETMGVPMKPEPVDLLVPAMNARVPALAQSLRSRLAEVEKLSGPSRLFAMRDLLSEVAGHPDADAPAVVDARIDAQLAWATWVRGDAAATRLAEAERLCERLGASGPGADARALRRKGEICLRRAQLVKASIALPELDRAQALFDAAHARAADAETALLVARTALQRARLLPPDEAADACAHALMHAFLAEQDAACRIDALACRLDIQLVYETLSDHAGQDGVAASLGRSLEASGPLAPAARVALAEAHLRDGAPAKAAALCESIWRDGDADDRVLALWRNACRHWTGTEEHDERLMKSLRRLAIARSTL
ncbi:hypothetical protein [Luteibacter yeojuensis]|uniref:Uncharacterized protein n=1 Tax=Luteibacter yeojuensis TaxID=345309 RepID=A0A7X5QRP4_9GAMM|nr:hypothetical protein [Luteibacter yeojuensis]NID14183.1 hypothetical protein [Luteibacter yeojuensis]